MITIEWAQFEKNQVTKDVSFESLCRQLAHILYKDFGSIENFYNTPGSEFYLKLFRDCPALNLKAGDRIGWQAKWWFDSEELSSLTTNRRVELCKNLGTTLSKHPDLKLWIICTPGKFVEHAFENLKLEAYEEFKFANLTHWDKTSFIDFASNDFKKIGPLLHFFFNTQFVSFDFIKEYSQAKLEALWKKFDADLYSPSQNDEDIFYLIETKKIFGMLSDEVKALSGEIMMIEMDEHFKRFDFAQFKDTKNLTQRAIENLPFETRHEAFFTLSYDLLYLSTATAKEIERSLSSGIKADAAKSILIALREHSGQARRLSALIQKTDIPRNINSRRMEFLVGSVDRLERHLIATPAQDSFKKTIIDYVQELLQKNINILSTAGYGKTNIACHICKTCLEQGIPCLLLLGSDFRRAALPQKIILEQLGLEHKYDFKQFLSALDIQGSIRGCKTPIIIDGLNESNPYDEVWRGNIKNIIRDIESFGNIILITTCRERYIESIFEETEISSVPNTKMLFGLIGQQKEEAIKKYFYKYEIVPSSWNFDKMYFGNPLLLKIFCESNQGRKNVYISLQNVFKSIESYIKHILDKTSFGRDHSTDRLLRTRAMEGIERLCTRLWKNNRREVSLKDFHAAIDPDSKELYGSLTEKLLDEGLCFQKNLSINSETVQFTYDLVGGYCIANILLPKKANTGTAILAALESANAIEKLLTGGSTHPLKQDILRSLMHIVPMQSGENIFEVLKFDKVIEECYNSIDYFINNERAQDKLFEFVLAEDKQGRNFKLLTKRLFENSYNRQNSGLGAFTAKVLQRLDQGEIDNLWTRLVDQNVDTVEFLLWGQTHAKSSLPSTLSGYEAPLLAALAGGSEKTVRSVTNSLRQLAIQHPDHFLEMGPKVISLFDLDIVVSWMEALCGSVLNLRSQAYTQKCIEFIINDFLPVYRTAHIHIIDCILTITSFGQSFFQIQGHDNIQLWHETVKEHEGYKVLNLLSPELSGKLPFGFEVFTGRLQFEQLPGLYENLVAQHVPDIEKGALVSISRLFRAKGNMAQQFDDTFKNGSTRVNASYPAEELNERFRYAKKYLAQALREFAGHLFLSGKIKLSRQLIHLREFYYFDISFPSFDDAIPMDFPTGHEDFDIDDIKENLCLRYPLGGGEWVLLHACFHGSADYYLEETILYETFWMPRAEKNDFEQKSRGPGFSPGSGVISHFFASELGWRDETVLSEKGEPISPMNFSRMVFEYRWKNLESGDRQEDHFYFISSYISGLMGLKPALDKSSFTDSSGKQVTMSMRTREGYELYYISKAVADEISENPDICICGLLTVTNSSKRSVKSTEHFFYSSNGSWTRS